MPIHGYLGGVISATAPTISPTSASGVWTLDDQLQNAANWPSQSNIARSLRFNLADSAYLSRTPASVSNRRTWTFSTWLKRSQLVNTTYDWRIFECRPAAGTYTLFDFYNSGGTYPNQMTFRGSDGTNLITSQVFRDASAWYHIVLAVDTTQATASDRVKIYVNGVQVTNFSASTYPAQNLETQINTANAHNIGRDPHTGFEFFDGYLADVYFIDGQALTPSSFGYTDSNGIWQPMSYTGTYGTNGFWLNFDDNSNTTATTLGKDSSGNGNNWTPNNFSVTAGAGNDSLVDSPTNYGTDTGVGGEVRGNYATANPLDKSSDVTLSNGNLNVVGTAGAWRSARSTFAISSGKWYWEVLCNTIVMSGDRAMLGLMKSTANINGYVGSDADGWGYYSGDGNKYTNSTATSYGATYTTNDVVGIAFDADAGTLVFYKNGVSQGTAFTNLLSGPYFPAIGMYAGSVSVNFGQRPFAYTAPAGFKALCSTNLPTPTIQKGGSYFNTVLWTGDGSYPRTITGVGFQPDFVWTKSRSSAFSHISYDVVRGTGTTKSLSQNETSAEGANSSNANLTAFTSDGFTVDSTTGTNVLNKNLDTFVAWNWKAGGTGVSNTAGSITSTVSANQTAGFSVVRWDGNGAGAAATIGHGLGSVPKMIINKGLDFTSAWSVYHVSAGNTVRLTLNSSSAVDTNSGYWNNTTPTSTVFTVGNIINQATPYDYVAYCFAEVPGYSAFGSYTGNGSSDGPFIYTGFRPAYVLVKNSSSARDWAVWDVKRNTFNLVNTYLTPNSSAAESSDNTVSMDILSNGFKVRGTWVGMNNSGETIIYAAFAENPFKIARAR